MAPKHTNAARGVKQKQVMFKRKRTPHARATHQVHVCLHLSRTIRRALLSHQRRAGQIRYVQRRRAAVIHTLHTDDCHKVGSAPLVCAPQQSGKGEEGKGEEGKGEEGKGEEGKGEEGKGEEGTTGRWYALEPDNQLTPSRPRKTTHNDATHRLPPQRMQRFAAAGPPPLPGPSAPETAG
jgi:hypothetical protein